MSTRSNIGIINSDGTIEIVYCHCDGYPSYNGKVLIENYSDTDKVRYLLSHGAICGLGSMIGKKHSSDDYSSEYKNWCLFYARDRGEKNARRDFFDDGVTFEDNFKEVIKIMQQYLYLWSEKDNVWYYVPRSSEDKNCKKLTLLTKEICDAH